MTDCLAACIDMISSHFGLFSEGGHESTSIFLKKEEKFSNEIISPLLQINCPLKFILVFVAL
jgi:hypothetical protein